MTSVEMTNVERNSIEEQRNQHMALAMAMASELTGRLDWDAARLHAHRTAALRALVGVAVDRSHWHRKRLAGVRPDRLTLADLPNLPAMTKTDLMAHFDEIVTDDRLTLAAVEEHLAEAGTRGYLFGEYTPIATGGSTGHRGLSVYDQRGFATYWLTIFRWLLYDRERDPALRGRSVTIAYVVSGHPSHGGAALARIFRDPASVRSASR